MIIGNAAAATAATPAAAAPEPRSKPVRILVIVNCPVLVIFGFMAFLSNLLNFTNLTVPVLALYMCIFGLVLSACELNMSFSKTYFGALQEWLGEAVFMIFVGTLGIAICTSSIAALLAGIYSIFAGIAVIVDQFACGRRLLNQTPAAS